MYRRNNHITRELRERVFPALLLLYLAHRLLLRGSAGVSTAILKPDLIELLDALAWCTAQCADTASVRARGVGRLRGEI